MSGLGHLIYLCATALQGPVVLGLLLALAWSLLELGATLRERRLRRARRGWPDYMARLRRDPAAAGDFFLTAAAYAGFLEAFARRGGDLRARPPLLAKLAVDLEVAASAALARTSLVARLAPALGLMGTLIPLGPALLGVSGGDLERVVQSLVVAFGTTVIGLFAGILCHGITLARRGWYAQDLANVEFVLSALEPGGPLT